MRPTPVSAYLDFDTARHASVGVDDSDSPAGGIRGEPLTNQCSLSRAALHCLSSLSAPSRGVSLTPLSTGSQLSDAATPNPSVASAATPLLTPITAQIRRWSPVAPIMETAPGKNRPWPAKAQGPPTARKDTFLPEGSTGSTGSTAGPFGNMGPKRQRIDTKDGKPVATVPYTTFGTATVAAAAATTTPGQPFKRKFEAPGTATVQPFKHKTSQPPTHVASQMSIPAQVPVKPPAPPKRTLTGAELFKDNLCNSLFKEERSIDNCTWNTVHMLWQDGLLPYEEQDGYMGMYSTHRMIGETFVQFIFRMYTSGVLGVYWASKQNLEKAGKATPKVNGTPRAPKSAKSLVTEWGTIVPVGPLVCDRCGDVDMHEGGNCDVLSALDRAAILDHIESDPKVQECSTRFRSSKSHKSEWTDLFEGTFKWMCVPKPRPVVPATAVAPPCEPTPTTKQAKADVHTTAKPKKGAPASNGSKSKKPLKGSESVSKTSVLSLMFRHKNATL